MNSLIKSRWTFAKTLLAVSAVFLLVPSAIGRNGGRLSAQEGLPGAESRPAMLRRELRKHIEKMDKLSEKLEAPDFPKGKDWFNSPPLSLKRELRGKIVILDFWTYCLKRIDISI